MSKIIKTTNLKWLNGEESALNLQKKMQDINQSI
jgi:hypothetical protein